MTLTEGETDLTTASRGQYAILGRTVQVRNCPSISDSSIHAVTADGGGGLLDIIIRSKHALEATAIYEDHAPTQHRNGLHTVQGGEKLYKQ